MPTLGTVQRRQISGWPHIQFKVETDPTTWHYPPWSSLPDVGILTNEFGGGGAS